MVVTAAVILNETASGELRQRKQVPTRREAQQYSIFFQDTTLAYPCIRYLQWCIMITLIKYDF